MLDFLALSQLKTKKSWWMDVLLYLSISVLIAAALCYLIFLLKNEFQRQEIIKVSAELEGIGNLDQKQQENDVLKYQKKLADYIDIFKNHQFATNVFAFIERQTLPNVWFSRFSLNRKAASVELSGECDDQETFSRQLAIFEKNEYVQNMGLINSKLGGAGKVQFNLNLSLDPKIFKYIENANK